MRIVIFGGTTEGRRLAEALAEAGAEVIVSVATTYGAEEMTDTDSEAITVAEGRLDETQMQQMMQDAALVVDATHPYAVLVSDNIRRAAAKEKIRMLRLLREESVVTGNMEADVQSTMGASNRDFGDMWETPNNDTPHSMGGVIRVAADAEDAARMARSLVGEHGHVLLTTGSKELGVYAAVLDPGRLYPRVLPLVDSIRACEEAGVPHRNIIAIQGPFSEALNRAVIADYQIDVMITKESGRAGGFQEKIRACQAAGIPAIVIARPPEDGMSYDAVLAECLTLLHAGDDEQSR